jgi:accessory gene regulator protein AgrB
MKFISLAFELFYIVFKVALVFSTLYCLAWAFLPYQTLETNAAGMFGFLALACYWSWWLSSLEDDKGFWQLF